MHRPYLTFNPILLPDLLTVANSFSKMGCLKMSINKLIYLDIHDDYIHQLYPLLNQWNQKIDKPDYFGEKAVGAHISVIYPEENILVLDDELSQRHYFTITGLFSADLHNKRYYVLGVKAPSLIALRNKHKLADKLFFKDHWIDLHITIGTSHKCKPAMQK